jgi:molybdopterin molybdotransferase
LRELGVDIFFNKVAIKPGKPTTFGKKGHTLVFGLPGNPVAAFVCFHLFVRTAVRVQLGAINPLPNWINLPLAPQIKLNSDGDRTTFRPCKLININNETCVSPIEWHGSGHLAALVGIDGLFVTRPGETPAPGQVVTYYPV